MRLVSPTFCLSCALALAACRAQVPTADVVARVNGEPVTKQAFEEVVARDLKRYGERRQALPEGVVARIQEAVLSGIVEDSIVAQRAHKEGIEVTAAELDATLAQHRDRFRSPEAYADYLARANTTEAQLREQLYKSLLRDRLVDKLGGPVEVAAADVKRHYDDNLEHFTEFEQMRVRRLMLALPKDASAGRAHAVKKQAHTLYEKAKRHPDTFAGLCRAHSDAPEAGRDGDLGLVIAGRMPEVDKLLAAGLHVGQVSEPVVVKDGIALFRIESHTPRRVRPLAEVEPQIRTVLTMHARNERRQQVMQTLHQDAKVDLSISFERAQSPSKAAPLPTGEAPRQEVGARALPAQDGRRG